MFPGLPLTRALLLTLSSNGVERATCLRLLLCLLAGLHDSLDTLAGLRPPRLLLGIAALVIWQCLTVLVSLGAWGCMEVFTCPYRRQSSTCCS